jgi:PAS domain S-box-containing protein
MIDMRKTILAVDDVPDDIKILEEILKGEYQVKAATSGEAALKIARGSPPPDLILLDVMMPGMDGFEVCRSLKEDAAGATIPVIFLTAKAMTADERLGFELGAVDYIKKPVDPGIVLSRVKTHLETKEQILRASEVRYRRLFEAAKDGMLVVDLETDTVIDANLSLATMLGLSLESFLGKRMPELKLLEGAWSRERGPRDRVEPLATADGRTIYVEAMRSSYRANNREVAQLNLRDVTELVAAERERDELSGRLSHYLSTSPTVTYSLELKGGEARWKWVSENIVELLGYSTEEALAPDWWFRNVHAPDRAGALGLIADLSRSERAGREYRFTTKDRQTVWLRDEMRLLRGAGGTAADSEIVGTLTDISAQKKAEEEIYLKSAALDAAANAVIVTDRDGIIRWANPAFGRLSGYSSAESVGKNPRELQRSGRQDALFYRVIWDTILSGEVWSGKLVNRRKSDELYTEEMTITPVLDAARYVTGFIAIKNDVTERELSRERLEATLREKDVLLREIHHRVKNNMQVIISLLNISAQALGDSGPRLKLEDIIRRVHSMALIHEQFYESKDMSRIDFSVYLRQLLDGLGGKFPASAAHATLACEAGEALLHLEQAIPAGLIATELLTNAMKYAYPEGAPAGAIRVSLRALPEGALELEVRDEGPGLPPGVDPASGQSMGMMLIRILSEQLGGSVEFRAGAGTDAVLRFPIEA